MDYLLKTEPTAYSFADLQRDKITVWDGVANPVALRHLREMKPGDAAGDLRDRRPQERGGDGVGRFGGCRQTPRIPR